MTQTKEHVPLRMVSAVRILGGFVLISGTVWLAAAVQRQMGLEGLELSAWSSLLLSCSSVLLLLALFHEVRQACLDAKTTIGSRVVVVLGGTVLCYNVVAWLLVAVLRHSGHAIAVPTHVGWAHYFSLPAGSRPGFLLHYLTVTAIGACVIAPLVEELFHVGIVITTLRSQKVRWAVVFAVNALLFVALHLVGDGRMPGVGVLLGYVVGRLFLDWLYYMSGNIALPIFAHALHNLRVLSYNFY